MNTTAERLLPWALRLVWIGVLVAGGPAIDDAVATSSSDVADVARLGGFVAWIAGVVAMAIPAVVSLTAVRIIVPLSTFVAVIAATNGADLAAGAAFVATSGAATVIAFSGELGRGFVQASAYGEEDRYPLRPPVAYAIASAFTWLIWASSLVAAPLSLAAGRWILGSISAIVAVGGLAFGWPRWHRLARRWFVVLPIGVVVHDQLVLAETLMLRRQEVASLRLAPVETEAADLTGPAAGHAVEIATAESVTAIVAATPRQPHGTAIHLTAALVAPTRPGRALRASEQRRLPVG